jgi:hypothetical protein
MSSNREFFERVGTEAAEGGHGNRARDPAHPEPIATGEQPPLAATTGAKRWAANHDVFWGATQTHDALPAGCYRCGISNNAGPILNRLTVENDDIITLPDDDSSAIVAEFEKFWTLEPAFRQRGFLMKRGFLLWGPPGSGKTSTVRLLVQRLITDCGGIVLLIEEPYPAAACLQMARQIEPKRPIIAIMEDVDALIERCGENQFLALLDGEAQVDNIVFVATTNYPERLDRRFIDRPSRFDTIRYIGMPSAAARAVYLQTKEPSLQGEELEAWVSASEGFSIAHLKEMIIAVRCFGQPPAQVVERLEAMHSRRPISTDAPDKQAMGFARSGRGNGRLSGAGIGRIA